MRKLLLFDIDGTLIGPCPPHGQAMREAMFEVYRVATDFRVLPNGLAGMTDSQIIIEVLTHYKIDSDLIKKGLSECIARSASIFSAKVSLNDVVALHGVHDLLTTLSEADCMLGLATGNIRQIAEQKMLLLGSPAVFHTGGFGCEYAIRAELVRSAIEKASYVAKRSFCPEDVWVIGDTIKDIQAARANAVKVLAVASGQTIFEELKEAKPDALVTSLSDTQSIVELLLGT